MKYRDLIFDLYGTLVDIHTDTKPAWVWEKTAFYFGFYGAGYGAEELREAYDAVTRQQSMDAGQSYECFPELQIEKVFAELFVRKGIVGGVEGLGQNAAQFFRILSMEYIRLYPGVKEALSKLKEDGHRLWLLSNAQRVFTAYEMELLGLKEYFDGIYISSDYGCRKPDIRFFDALIKERALKAEDCLMIGNDLTTDIKGAQAAGLCTFYIHSNISPAQDAHAARTADYSVEEADWFEIAKKLEAICS